MSCVFRAHTDDGPCPWCAEAQGRVLTPSLIIGLAWGFVAGVIVQGRSQR